MAPRSGSPRRRIPTLRGFDCRRGRVHRGGVALPGAAPAREARPGHLALGPLGEQTPRPSSRCFRDALGPALSLSGRIEFDATTLTPPEKLAGVRVSLTRAGAATPTVVNGIGLGLPPPPAAAAQPDGSFTMTGILPGTYGLASGVPGGGTATTGWWLRSAIVNGRDVLDHPLEVGGTTSNMSGAVLTFTDRRNELTGTLTTATGAPASEFIVVVYAADESYWRPGARRLRSTRPASDGAFTVVGLPAGDYLIAALTDIDPDAWQHPDFLRQLVSASVKVAIRDGEVTRQDLRISR
jgi:hypothetical protein